MKKLHNLEDRRVLKARMDADSRPRTTLSFYRYVHLEDPQKTRSELYEAWTELEVLGRTYVAKEGINAQISIPTERFEAFKDHIESLGWLPNLRLNVAVEQGKSFFKLIVRVREKIVADGLEDGTFDVTDCGKHLKASEFNELTDKEDTVLIDMRNATKARWGTLRAPFVLTSTPSARKSTTWRTCCKTKRTPTSSCIAPVASAAKRQAPTSSTKASRMCISWKEASLSTPVKRREPAQQIHWKELRLRRAHGGAHHRRRHRQMPHVWNVLRHACQLCESHMQHPDDSVRCLQDLHGGDVWQ